MALTNVNRRLLAERVRGRLAGRGISRREIGDSVNAVSRSLETSWSATATIPPAAVPTSAGGAVVGQESVLALSAVSVPDLASRVREAPAVVGFRPRLSGVGSAGRHTVVTLSAGAADDAAVRRIAARLGACAASVSASPEDGR